MRIRILEIPPLPGTLDACLEALTCVNAAVIDAALRGGGALPLIYEADVWWQREPIGVEDWYTCAEVLRRRDAGLGSDCEDLSAWRAGELRVRYGEPARAIAYAVKKHHYHAVVERADGTIEDPSRIVGRERKR